MLGTLTAFFVEIPLDDSHAELFREAARYVPPAASVLDAGCGLGLLLDVLPGDVAPYLGLDGSAALIEACRRRHRGRAGAKFQRADLMTADLGTERYDAVALLNTLDAPDFDAVELLRKSRSALRSGGLLLVASPSSPARFAKIQAQALCRLEDETARTALLEENRRRLVGDGSVWSLEGMLALLGHLGFGRVRGATNGLYAGAAYLVAVGR